MLGEAPLFDFAPLKMAGRQDQAGDGDTAVSRTPTTPGKPRLQKSNTSPIKKEEKHQKQAAKDVSELKDYVRIFPVGFGPLKWNGRC